MHDLGEVKIFGLPGVYEELAVPVREGLFQRFQGSLNEQSVVLGEAKIVRFSNTETQVEVDDVRGREVVVLHSHIPPVNDNLILLLQMLDAIVNSEPQSIYLVFSYQPYQRSDRKTKARTSAMSPLLAKIINETLGINHVLLVEPHDSHLKHYYCRRAAQEIPIMPLLVRCLERGLLREDDRSNTVAVFADAGAASRYKQAPRDLRIPAAYIDKERFDHSETPLPAELIGDVEGKDALILDDEVLSGKTAFGDAELLKRKGAKSVRLVVSHGIFADKDLTNEQLMARIQDSPIEEIIFTDSIPQGNKLVGQTKFTSISVCELLSEAIHRLITRRPLSVFHSRDTLPLP
jgi:ribose-phosphate pyrophosphokinase